MSVTGSDSDMTSTMETVAASIKSLTASELFKLIKLATTEAEKKTKSPKTTAKTTATKKSGSMPKGAVPKQLLKPRAWVEYTLKDALANGWESFTVHQSHKNKETGEKVEEEIEMPPSMLHNGAHVYEGSVTEATPDGRQLIHKEAMSLSKQRKESGHASYAAFEASYVEETPATSDSDASSTTSSKVTVIKKTAAEKAAEAEAKKAAKAAEKEAKKAEKEAEKEAKKAEKEAEKEAKKAAKDAEKAAKKPQSSPARAAGLVAAKPVVPAKAVAAPKPVAAATTPAEPAATPKKTKPVAKVDIPNDGMVHPWTYKGKKYLRNADGETWTVGADGGVGEWVGMYDSKTDKLDTTAAEPVFEDEE